MKTITKLILLFVLLTGLIQAGPRKVKVRDAGWYLRTVVTATTADNKVYTHKTAGVFGLLRHSKNKKDKHDIPAYGESGAILQILFTPTSWGEDNGNYFSNYQHYNKRRPYRRRVWEFQVRNPRSVNLADADLKIAVEGPYKISFTKKNGNIEYTEYKDMNPDELLSKLTLIDIDNQVSYSYDELKNLTLNMDGKHTRSFRWILGQVKARDFKAFETD